MSGWHRVMAGCYSYTNKSGKYLAQVNQQGKSWGVWIFPMGDGARQQELSLTIRTLREAKELAKTQYILATKRALKEENELLDRLRAQGHLD